MARACTSIHRAAGTCLLIFSRPTVTLATVTVGALVTPVCLSFTLAQHVSLGRQLVAAALTPPFLCISLLANLFIRESILREQFMSGTFVSSPSRHVVSMPGNHASVAQHSHSCNTRTRARAHPRACAHARACARARGRDRGRARARVTPAPPHPPPHPHLRARTHTHISVYACAHSHACTCFAPHTSSPLASPQVAPPMLVCATCGRACGCSSSPRAMSVATSEPHVFDSCWRLLTFSHLLQLFAAARVRASCCAFLWPVLPAHCAVFVHAVRSFWHFVLRSLSLAVSLQGRLCDLCARQRATVQGTRATAAHKFPHTYRVLSV